MTTATLTVWDGNTDIVYLYHPHSGFPAWLGSALKKLLPYYSRVDNPTDLAVCLIQQPIFSFEPATQEYPADYFYKFNTKTHKLTVTDCTGKRCAIPRI